MARVFLTGATGFVGSFVAQELITRQHQVSCLVRPTSDRRWLKDLPVEYQVGSLLKIDTFLEALKNTEYVIHVAGVTSARNSEQYFAGNVQPTESLLQAIDAHHPDIRRFLLVSSQAVTGPSPTSMPVDENYPLQPITDYGISKLESEKACWSYSSKFPITIVRPPAVYGPRDDGVYNFFRLLKYGINPMIGSTDQLVNMVYVEDLARGIVQAAFSPPAAGRTYFLCEEKSYYWSEVARIAARIMDKKYLTIRLPYHLIYGLAFFLEKIAALSGTTTILNRQKMNELKQPYWVISPRRAQSDFDYQTLVPLPEGIEKTVRWYRENHWL